ncbi:MAG: arsenic resistance N-acetyltransferase ArsN2 [Acidobacteriia bacterium]|nr:arsenic resistance N-acetyltransferase ArsN2 [Terriglobia bacterium]
MDVRIERARAQEFDAVLQLLEEHHLPPDGLRDHVETTLVARADGRIVGSAALEIYRDGALMRSVAVAPAVQGQGLGQRLTEAIVDLAREKAVPAIYLLTTTADRYFPKFGFERITRDAVPDTVKASVEFASACPSTATVMRKVLRDAP